MLSLAIPMPDRPISQPNADENRSHSHCGSIEGEAPRGSGGLHYICTGTKKFALEIPDLKGGQ